MRSKASPARPSSSWPRVDDRLVEAAARDPLRGALEPADPARVHRRERVAEHERRTSEPDQRRRASSRRWTNCDARERVGERVAEQDHDVRLGVDRHRHLCEPAAVAARRCRAAARRSRPRAARSGRARRRREDVAFESPMDQDAGSASSDAVDDDPRVDDRRRRPRRTAAAGPTSARKSAATAVSRPPRAGRASRRRARPRATARRSGRRPRARRRRRASSASASRSRMPLIAGAQHHRSRKR